MKRLCVYLMYDKDAIIDEYKIYMLRCLALNAQKTIVIINGEMCSTQRIRDYADYVITRENIGYDVGAYKDLFEGKLIDIFDFEWDEIVLVNDSVYGPIYDLKTVFSCMDHLDVNCWSLGRYIPDGINVRYLKNDVAPEHLQSFFLAYRRSMVDSKAFSDYWMSVRYPMNYEEAVIQAEFKHMEFIKASGYKYTSWMDQVHCGELMNTIAVYEHVMRLLTEYHFPVVKCKLFTLGPYIEKADQVMNYLRENTSYDVTMINKASKRRGIEDYVFKTERLMNFIESHKRIFVFGHGIRGKNIACYLKNIGACCEGFVVSKPNCIDEIGLDKFELDKEDGLIVALCNKWVEDVKSGLIERFDENQILFPDK